MPKMRCTCGEILSESAIPNPIEWRVVSDAKLDTFSDKVDVEEIYGASDTMLRCPRCERIWIFWNGSDVATEYVKVPRS